MKHFSDEVLGSTVKVTATWNFSPQL